MRWSASGTCCAGDRTSHEIMTTLLEWLHTTPVRVFHETSAIALLKSGDAVMGALALDRSGGLLLFRADSVILAAGGGAKIYASSTNSASGTGEGYTLALQRREEIEKTGADAVVSVCPFCEFHLREHTGRRVQNVCTLLLEGCREKDRQQPR